VTINAPVRTTTRSTRSIGWVPFALVALVLVPAIAGSLRLVELAGGPHVLPANPGTIISRWTIRATTKVGSS
jgi:hypothetical protein